MDGTRLAGFWIRVLALVIDSIAMMVLCVPAAIAYFLLGGDIGDERSMSLTMLSVIVIYSLQELFFARTLGKLAMGLRIVGPDRLTAPFARRFLRWSTKWLPWLLQVPAEISQNGGLYYLSGISLLFVVIGFLPVLGDDKRSWYDEWSGTTVTRRGGAPVPPPPAPA